MCHWNLCWYDRTAGCALQTQRWNLRGEEWVRATVKTVEISLECREEDGGVRFDDTNLMFMWIAYTTNDLCFAVYLFASFLFYLI